MGPTEPLESKGGILCAWDSATRALFTHDDDDDSGIEDYSDDDGEGDSYTDDEGDEEETNDEEEEDGPWMEEVDD
jgi:hypothetical protein